MAYPLDFISDFGSYEVDDVYPPEHERFGESTGHMLSSGHWTWTGQPTNRDGLVNFNHYAGPSTLGVQEPSGSAGANSYTLSADIGILELGTRGGIRVMSVGGPTGGLGLWFSRSGTGMGVDGQAYDHALVLGGFSGGTLDFHVEVDPDSGLWYCEATAGASLALQACGNAWNGGLLTRATVGQGSFGGGSVNAVLTCTSMSGSTSTRVGLPECPIPAPEPGEAVPRTRAIWLPYGE